MTTRTRDALPLGTPAREARQPSHGAEVHGREGQPMEGLQACGCEAGCRSEAHERPAHDAGDGAKCDQAVGA